MRIQQKGFFFSFLKNLFPFANGNIVWTREFSSETQRELHIFSSEWCSEFEGFNQFYYQNFAGDHRITIANAIPLALENVCEILLK